MSPSALTSRAAGRAAPGRRHGGRPRPRARTSRRERLRRAAEHLSAGRPAEAAAACRELLGERPDDPAILHVLGIAAHQQGDSAGAAELIARAIAGRPGDKTFHNSLGIVLLHQEQLAAAAAAHRRAIELDPDFAEAHFNLGNVLSRQEDYEAAIAAFESAVALRPGYAEAHGNRAAILLARGERGAAIAAYRQAIAARPDFYDGHFNLAMCHGGAGEHAAAIAAYREAIRLRPDVKVAHVNLSMSLLATGDLVQGFAEYEWRWGTGAPVVKAGLHVPPWDGSPLAGRRLLLTDEQGLGDTIQFIRYAKLLAGRGGIVYAECAPPLARLLATCPGLAGVVPAGGPYPELDLQVPLLSVPRLLGTDLAGIPGEVPYLCPPDEERPDLDAALAAPAGVLRVGIVWAGNPGHLADAIRSCPLECFRPLAAVPGVRLFAVLFGPRAADLASLPDLPVTDCSAILGDFADTAAIVRRLDLVLTVDTSMAHLAGAIGAEVWTLLCAQPDWRWLIGRDDSPWYPTMRLFRQESLGDWPGVMGEVEAALRRRAERRPLTSG